MFSINEVIIDSKRTWIFRFLKINKPVFHLVTPLVKVPKLPD